MTEQIHMVVKNIFGDNVIFATMVIAIIPLIELRGAIPFAMSTALFGANALSPGKALVYSMIGSSLIAPFMVMVFMPIVKCLKDKKFFKKMSKNFYTSLEEKSQHLEIEDTNNRKNKYFKMFGLFAFVAVPLPLTGVYTASCIGVVVGMSFWDIMISTLAGNLCAGLIMTLISSTFADNTIIVLYVFLVLIVCFAIISLIRKIVKYTKKN